MQGANQSPIIHDEDSFVVGTCCGGAELVGKVSDEEDMLFTIGGNSLVHSVAAGVLLAIALCNSEGWSNADERQIQPAKTCLDTVTRGPGGVPAI